MKKFLLSIFCLFSLVGFATAEEATLSFADKANRTVFTTSQQVWEQNGITLTNNKSASTSNVGDYFNPARFYKSSQLILETTKGMSKVVFKCNSTSYATELKNSIPSGATVSSSDVTVELNGETSFTVEKLTAQVRVNSLTVTFAEVAEAAVATPTFSVEAGTQYNPFSVEISAEEGATVYYTLDGTEPTTESAVYSEAIAFNEFGTSTTLKAIAAVDGELSNVASATYSLEVAAPAFSVKGGVYEKLTGETALQFTCETEGATIYYNNRGGDPKTEGSKSYGSLSVLSTAEVKAVAYVEVEGEKIYSDVVSEKYYISPVKPFEKATTFSAGEYLIVCNNMKATPMSETLNYGRFPGEAVTVNGNFIETNAHYAFTFTEVEGGYTIQDTFGRYLYASSKDSQSYYNTVNVGDDTKIDPTTAAAIWTVSIAEDGKATIKNTLSGYTFHYSSSYKNFETQANNAVLPSLYKLGEYPTMTVTPENWETLPAFEKVTITCESGISINETDENYPYYTIGWDNTPYEFDNTVFVGENTIELTFNKPIEDNGDYRVVLPAGLFTLDPDGLAMPSAKVQNTITVENLNVLEVAYANPDNGSTVKSIEYLYFEFNQNIVDNVSDAVITNENGDEFPLTVTYTDAWGEQTPLNALCLQAAEPITAPGVYTFVLKKQYVCAEANAAVTIAEELTYTFTIVEGLKIANITPANGAEVEAIEDILIEFNKEITCMAEAFYMTSDKGAEYYLTPSFNDKENNELPYNSIRLVAETPITAAGTYTLYIEDYNIGTTDWMNMEILPAQTLTFIIPGEGGGDGEVDYTPTYTGAKTRNDRNMLAVTLDANRYELTSTEQNSCYVDVTETVKFTVAAGATVQAAIETGASWIHSYVFIDTDANGFTAGIEEGSDYAPTGDLMAYSFYNNDATSDELGWNSIGDVITGDNRNKPAVPAFTAPAQPGVYRMRFKLDWCNIDPMGDSDGKFNDFMGNGGQIIDVMLEVVEATPELPALETTGYTPAEPVEKLETITITFSENIEVTGIEATDQFPIYSENSTWPVAMANWSVYGDVLTLNLGSAITEAGTYKLILNAEIFAGIESGAKMESDAVIYFTVNGTTGIEGVDAEVEQTIYDLTGRRIETITKGGIYIVGGKKVIVK